MPRIASGCHLSARVAMLVRPSRLGQDSLRVGRRNHWKALHEKSGRPIALPTYPFERQRHWFPLKPENTSASLLLSTADEHPLLGSRVNSPLAEIQFASQIGPDRPSYLGDHVVAGRRVVPAAAYLDMALSAAKAVVCALPANRALPSGSLSSTLHVRRTTQSAMRPSRARKRATPSRSIVVPSKMRQKRICRAHRVGHACGRSACLRSNPRNARPRV